MLRVPLAHAAYSTQGRCYLSPTAPIQLFLNHCLHCGARTSLPHSQSRYCSRRREAYCGTVLLSTVGEAFRCCIAACSRLGESGRHAAIAVWSRLGSRLREASERSGPALRRAGLRLLSTNERLSLCFGLLSLRRAGRGSAIIRWSFCIVSRLVRDEHAGTASSGLERARAATALGCERRRCYVRCVCSACGALG